VSGSLPVTSNLASTRRLSSNTDCLSTRLRFLGCREVPAEPAFVDRKRSAVVGGDNSSLVTPFPLTG
jgi:hypothetical protein